MVWRCPENIPLHAKRREPDTVVSMRQISYYGLTAFETVKDFNIRGPPIRTIDNDHGNIGSYK
jgi:hypothetical protein